MKRSIILPLLLSTPTLWAAERVNIILIMADDLGHGDTQLLNEASQNLTPNICRMAERGVLLTDYHSNGAVSSPTRAALLTGRYQQRVGITNVISQGQALPLEEFTLAEAFKEEGYTTAIYGKWHLGEAEAFNPTKHGFDHFEGYLGGSVDYHTHTTARGGGSWWRGTEQLQIEGYTTDIITDRAVAFIENQAEDAPFFLYLPHEAVHTPLQVRDPKSTTETMSDRELYREMIEILDEGVGRVLDALEQSPHADNTIVIFTSDNGGSRNVGDNTPLRGQKSSLYEGGHRLPLVIYSPGVELMAEVPSRYNSTVMSMDLFPSLISLVGGTPPENMDGVNIFQYLMAGEPIPERDLFWGTSSEVYAMRRGDWKYIMRGGGSQEAYLFDLSTDLSERRDMTASHPEVAEQMRAAIAEWLAEVTPPNMEPRAPRVRQQSPQNRRPQMRQQRQQ